MGPLLYILYTAELEQVVIRHGMRLHQYAGDSQLYIHETVSDTAVAEQCLTACVSEVNHWMRVSRLRLNPAKTGVMWLGSHQQLKNVDITDIPILSMQVKVSESLLVIWELCWTASCHYHHMLLRSVELDFFTFDNYVQLFDQ